MLQKRRPEGIPGGARRVGQRVEFAGGGVLGGGGAFFFFDGGSAGTRGSVIPAGIGPGLAAPRFVTGSPKMTRALAGRFRTAVGQSVGAACLLAGTFGSQMRHIPAGGRALEGTLSAGRGCSCAPRGAVSTVPIRTTDKARRIFGSPRGQSPRAGDTPPQCMAGASELPDSVPLNSPTYNGLRKRCPAARTGRPPGGTEPSTHMEYRPVPVTV